VTLNDPRDRIGLLLRGWRDGWGDLPGGGKDCGQLPPGLRGFLSTITRRRFAVPLGLGAPRLGALSRSPVSEPCLGARASGPPGRAFTPGTEPPRCAVIPPRTYPPGFVAPYPQLVCAPTPIYRRRCAQLQKSPRKNASCAGQRACPWRCRRDPRQPPGTPAVPISHDRLAGAKCQTLGLSSNRYRSRLDIRTNLGSNRWSNAGRVR